VAGDIERPRDEAESKGNIVHKTAPRILKGAKDKDKD
jgi:hypothetical protein